jgi:hypothetical protein
MELPKNVTAEQVLEAVRQGLRDAFDDLLQKPGGSNLLDPCLKESSRPTKAPRHP